jgi:hypothetical protein
MHQLILTGFVIFIELMFSWITLAWMDGEECVTMALDASIEERPYVDKYIVKITRKIGLEGWRQNKVLMRWKKCQSHL